MSVIDYNVVKIAFEKSPFAKYECVLNVPYNDEYSETLDSMSVVIKHIDSRLEINPFDVVDIYRGVVVSGTIQNPTYADIKWKEMLVDSVNMLRKRYGKNTYYEYTIKLMSETKWLEKIQLPNRSFTHALGGSLRDAYETIEDLMTYVPKVVRDNKEQSLIGISETVSARFSGLGMKDMSLSKPTLRQALTAVMSQFGCIPVVNNKQLGFINFNRSQGNITEEQVASMDSESYSNSSDSYVNTLMTDASQVLGDDKSLVVERGIGFRDRDAGLIKQQENLKLLTTYPIYKVKNLTINMNLSTYPCIVVKVYNIADADYFILPSSNPEGDFNPIHISENTNEYVVKVYCGGYQKIDFSNWSFKILEVINPSTDGFGCEGFKTSSVKTGVSRPAQSQWGHGTMYTFAISKNGMVRPSGTVAYLFIANISGEDKHIVWNTYVEDNGNSTVISGMYKEMDIGIVYRKVSIDITKLVKTAQERRLLSYDYTTDEFKNGQGNMAVYSKYYYTTVQYKLGGNEISGWSDKYTEAQGWWGVNKTTIENIVNKSFYENEFLSKRYDNIFSDEDILPYPQWFYSYEYVDGNGNKHPVAVKSIYSNGWVDDMFGSYNYPSRISFDISYQPLSDLNIATTKNDFDYPLAQLDSRSNGLLDFGNFKKVEQDKLDRLGNGVHILSKRYFATDDKTNLESELIPLGAVHMETGEVVFKRTISFKNNYIDVAYYLCKDYVIANYSTSITTKYRAYQYVDYSSSTFRNENRISYFTISDAFTNVDCEEKDVLGISEKYWGGVATMGDNNIDMLCSGMIFAPFLYNNNVRSMNMGYRRVKSTAYSNDNPIVSYSVFQQATSHYLYDYGLVVSFKYWDTVSPGIMLESNVRATGLPQHPYMYDDKSSVVKYANEQDIGLMAVPSDNGWTSQAESSAKYAQIYPAINDSKICVGSFIDIAYMSFDISDIIQDQSELMGFTMQIEYRSLTNKVVIFQDISKVARIFNDDENPSYTYRAGFCGTYDEASAYTGPVVPYGDVISASENKIIVKSNVTIYYGDTPLISMKQGTYYVRLSKYNKKVNIIHIGG